MPVSKTNGTNPINNILSTIEQPSGGTNSTDQTTQMLKDQGQAKVKDIERSGKQDVRDIISDANETGRISSEY